ncbi:MAG: UbiA family prenyltransferase [Candidatus Lokiarchaeota archaeon]|nr:UbiA family prenyltransferase [Candidatus Lokiarchaeota archaeon]
MRIITIKNDIIDLRPVIWIKGIFMVIIGLETTRLGVGIGRVNTNIYYGSFIFALIAISGMLVIFILKDRDRDEKTRRFSDHKLVITFSAVFYGVAFGLAIYYTITYNLESLNVYLLAFIGISWFLTLYYGRDWKYKGILRNVIISICFSFGLIYGASLNYTLIPAIIYLFFGAVFLLQISKDLMNDCKHIARDDTENPMSIATILGEEKAQKLSMILDILIIIFLIIPMFPGFPNIFAQSIYIYIAIITIVFVGIAAFLSFRMNKEKTYYRIVKIFLRCGMFLAFTGFILANF